MDGAPGDGACVPVSRTTRILATTALATATTLFGGVGSLSSAPTACSSYGSYSASASADGVRVLLGPAGLLPFDTADGEGPAASAHADSLGSRSAYAAGVYSDAAIANLPFVTGIDFAQVPVLVMASHPAQPSSSRDLPGLSLQASSTETSSTASATLGPSNGDGGGTGRVRTNAGAGCGDDGTIAATAVFEAEGLAVAGIVRVGSLRSSVSASVGSQGRPELKSDLAVKGLSVAGQEVAVTGDGLVVGPAGAPLSGGETLEALEAAGVSVRYLAPVTDADGRGRLAAGLEITLRHRIEGIGTGPASVTVVLGRAYARVDAAGAGGDLATGAGTPSAGDGGAEVGSGGAETSFEFNGTPLDADAAERNPAGAVATELGRAVVPTSPVSGVSTGGAAAAGLQQEAAAAPRVLLGRSIAAVYPAIGLAAVALTLAVVAFHVVGVRVRWR